MPMQVNLLPDIKQERLQAERRKRLIVGSAVTILVIAIGVPVVLFSVNQGIKFAESRTQQQIDERKAQIQEFEDINTMLTVQSQLESLPDLYRQRAYISELTTVINQVLPAEVSLTSLDIAAGGSVQFTGVSPTFFHVQLFHEALQEAGIDANEDRVDPDPDTQGHFTSVILENVSNDTEDVSFTVSSQFSPELIDGEPNGEDN